MTIPNIFADGYTNSPDAFLNAPAGKGSYAPSLVRKTVTIESGTAADTIVGFIPFNEGAKLSSGSLIAAIKPLGASVTYSIGYIYDDNTLTDDVDAFKNAATANTAGVGVLGNEDSVSFEAEGNGWIVINLAGATTGTENPITLEALVTYA